MKGRLWFALQAVLLVAVLAGLSCHDQKSDTASPHQSVASQTTSPTSVVATSQCLTTSANEQAKAAAAFAKEATSWKSSFVREGKETAFIVRPDQGMDVVSEGIAYGMIIAVHTNDRPLFDKLWAYAQARSRYNSQGFMPWRVLDDGSMPDPNAATDAELDMVYALLVADKVWGGYQSDAVMLINKIQAKLVDETALLKPGEWGGQSATNPSYQSPGYYPIFKAAANVAQWDFVAARGRQLFDQTDAKTASGNTGLYPNWRNGDGGPSAMRINDDQDNFTYDAFRVSWRQLMAVQWFCSDQTLAQHANNILTRMNATFERIGVQSVVAGYKIDGTPLVDYQNSAVLASVAWASAISTNQQYREQVLDRLVNAKEDQPRYYNNSLRVLALLSLSGKMINPLN